MVRTSAPADAMWGLQVVFVQALASTSNRSAVVCCMLAECAGELHESLIKLAGTKQTHSLAGIIGSSDYVCLLMIVS